MYKEKIKNQVNIKFTIHLNCDRGSDKVWVEINKVIRQIYFRPRHISVRFIVEKND